MIWKHRCYSAFLKTPALFLCLVLPSIESPMPASFAEDRVPRSDKAEFDIFVNDKRIGQEKYSIEVSGDTIISHSIVNFRDPGNQHQKVQMETQLNMDRHYLPQSYQLRTYVDGQKGTITGTFIPGEADFEYLGSGKPRKRGLLVGDRFIVLDTNVFHHFIFLARLFDFNTVGTQNFETIIPQELDEGILKVNQIGFERITIKGKKRDLYHLRADSGLLKIDLWVDDHHTLYKIALPAKNIEVLLKS
jgi:hypothetical protein